MKEEIKKKNKIIGISIGIVIVLLVVISATYAYWQITRRQEDENVLKAACLDLNVEFGESLSLQSEWPIDDSEALKDLTGYKFTVTNNCPYATNYVVGLESVEDAKITKYMSYASVALAIDNNPLGTYDLLPNLTGPTANARASKELMTGEIGKGETKTHQLKLWIDKNASVDDQSKGFVGKVFLIGGQGIENDNELVASTPESCFGFDEATGEITSYKEECGTSVVIPNSIAGAPVKVIDTNAFKGESTFTSYYDDEMNPVASFDVSDYTLAVVFDVSSINNFTGNEISYMVINTDDEDIITFAENAASEMEKDLGREIEIKTPTEASLSNPNQLVQYTIISKTANGNLEEPEIIGWVHNTLGTGVVIKSLDLSKAYNLERVEEFAFSNTTADTNTEEEYNSTPISLTNLTFGNNNKEIYFERGAFAKISSKQLTLYPSYKHVDDTFANLNTNSAFFGALIDKVIISATPEFNEYLDWDVDVQTQVVTNYPIAAGIDAGEVRFDNNVNTTTSELFRGAKIDKLYATPECTTQGEHSCGVSTSTSVNEVFIPAGVTEIGTNAFSNINLKKVTIPSSVKTIGYRAFLQENSLIQLSFEDTNEKPSQLETIGNYAFASQTLALGTNLNIVLPRNLKTIGEYAFEQLNISELTIPASIETIGEGAFRLCQYIGHVTFLYTDDNPSQLKTIGYGAFQKSTSYAYNTGTVRLPNGFSSFAQHFTTTWNIEYY